MASIRDGFILNIGRWAGKLSHGMLGLSRDQHTIFPFYHAISDHSIAHIDHLYKVKSSQQFISDLDYLLKNYEPIDLPTYLDHINGAKAIDKPSFLLSFDDGLREFYDVIAPILIRKGIPAICFLNSGFIDNKDLFFRYKVGLLIEKYHNDTKWAANTSLLEWKEKYDSTDEDLSVYLLKLRYNNINKVDELAEILDVDFDLFLKEQQPYLTSDQVKELINQGFYFGAHSIDHPEYQYLDEGEQIRQTVESLGYVCKQFKVDYKAFAFPFTDYGVKESFFKKIEELKLTDLLMGGAGLKREVRLNHVQRISMERGDMSAREILHGELLYRRISSIFGTDKIRRA